MNDSQSKTAGSEDGLTRSALIDLVEERLCAVYHCTRVWEAWQVGTMTQDDFVEARGTDLAPDIADAVLSLVATQAGALQAVKLPPLPKRHGFFENEQTTAGWTAEQVIAYARSALAATQPNAAPAAEVVALMRFYSVDSADALIAAQARHIEKLQSKLQPVPSFAPQRVREG